MYDDIHSNALFIGIPDAFPDALIVAFQFEPPTLQLQPWADGSSRANKAEAVREVTPAVVMAMRQ